VARGGTGGKPPPLAARPTIRTHVPESEELWIHHHHIFSKRGTACTQSKSGMVAQKSGVHPVSVGIGIILLCVTNTTSSLHLNNARLQTGRVWRRTLDVHTAVSNAAPRRQAFYHRSQSSLYKQGPRLIGHARPGKYYISGVLTVPQTLSNAQAEFYWMDSNSKAPTCRCGESARF